MKFFQRIDRSFLQPNDIDVALVILSKGELRSLIEKIKQFPTINFKEGKLRCEVTESGLRKKHVTSFK